MTIHCWLEYSYYDGLLTFAQMIVILDPQSPVKRATVRWLNSEVSM